VIEQVREQMPSVSVRTLCCWLGVNRRWYYQRRKQVKQEERETSLRKAMEEIILSFPGSGYRRVTHALARVGWKVNHKRVLSIMRAQGWLCHRKRQTVHTTDSRHRYRR
jgi:putative transposase